MPWLHLWIRIGALTACLAGSWAQADDRPTSNPSGADLFKFCTSQDAVSQMSCGLYVAGFVHGMKQGKGLDDVICLPELLTPVEAEAVFVRTLREMKKRAESGAGTPIEANPFFTEPQDAALAAALGLNFPCKK